MSAMQIQKLKLVTAPFLIFFYFIHYLCNAIWELLSSGRYWTFDELVSKRHNKRYISVYTF